MLELGDIDQEMLIFGGPYSNLAATAAMRQRARDSGIPVDRVICTGDMVAYCAEPAETLELIRDWGVHVVMGNCEEALAFSEPDCGCGFEEGSSCSTLAITWYQYADQRVDAELRRWMRALPRSIAFEMSGIRFRTVHGSLSSINEFVFASSDADAKLAQIREAGADVMIGGHSGIPFGQRIGDCFWLNAGVIGMPANDGGNHGWYLLIDPTPGRPMVSWHRLEYDHESSREATIAAGMVEYGQALASGLWPSVDILPQTERRQRGQPLHLPPISL
ncbi:MAG: metallophosphatase family protein [Gammaproteobacteria bacterium]|nr:metallophosphatase family protein [Gammaproteobacteria bacterium]MDH3534219.1 metallophosphatase family protein [Gammaproteobacteria bacterium]